MGYGRRVNSFSLYMYVISIVDASVYHDMVQ